MSERRNIPFSPPDISQAEIDAVVEVLQSGWITSGPNLAAFEKEIEEYCKVLEAENAETDRGCIPIYKGMPLTFRK